MVWLSSSIITGKNSENPFFVLPLPKVQTAHSRDLELGIHTLRGTITGDIKGILKILLLRNLWGKTPLWAKITQ